MRIKLEFEDGPIFTTISHPTAGQHRAMVVKINGKAFSVWRTVGDQEIYFSRGEEYIREVDQMLVASMERMLGKIFLDACAAVPDGAELLGQK